MSNYILKAKNSMKPARMWIDGQCFTIKQMKSSKMKKVNKIDIADHGFNIVSDDNGKLRTSFRLPDVYYRKIVAHRNFKLNELEVETKTKITIPLNGREGGLTIIGEDVTNIVEARHQVHSVIEHIRNSHRPMQFISIPILSNEIRENFERFKNEILNGEPIEGVDETIFQSGLKLHLTMSVFSLFDDTEINEAIKALQDYKESVLNHLIAGYGPLKIQVAGLDCMESNLAKVNVLYTNAKIVDEEQNFNLQKIANSIVEYFYERGFVKKPEENVKLHCTLMNTKYRKPLNETSSKKKYKWQKRQSFDARSIIEKYKDHNFGVCNFDSIHLSLMTSKGEDGYYKPLSILKFDN